MQSLKIGSFLRNGTYRIEKVLGQGGFGITYLATDITLERKVAIKEFFPKDYCDRDGATSQVSLGTKNTADFVKRLKAKFLKEARNIARFDHPGVIRIHAAFEENNTAYYVMEYILGGSLSEMVKRDGPLPPERALRYIGKVGKALEYVHAQKINHLDVKPANIMLRESDDNPILIDFGLSKQYDSEGHQTSTTPTGISHGFAPMEQYNDGGVREFSPQTDLYSLAATLYYLLSGVVPPQATLLVEDELTFPTTIPSRLVAPISKAMSSARRERQATVKDFLDEINGDSETEIHPTPGPQPKPKSKSEPKPQPKPQPQPQPEPPTQPMPPSKKKWYFIGAGVAMAIVVAVAIWAGVDRPASPKPQPDNPALVADSVKTVEGMYYTSSLGACSYTGEVDSDGKPHGKGKAEWETGLGRSYDGQWTHGEMDGDCVYTNRDNYRFEGKFKKGHYSQGKLISPDGSYYEGSFDKNGDKWSGTEYDRSGKETARWINGE